MGRGGGKNVEKGEGEEGMEDIESHEADDANTWLD